MEVFRYDRGVYVLFGTFGGDDPVTAPPFDAVAIPPAFLWGRKP